MPRNQRWHDEDLHCCYAFRPVSAFNSPLLQHHLSKERIHSVEINSERAGKQKEADPGKKESTAEKRVKALSSEKRVRKKEQKLRKMTICSPLKERRKKGEQESEGREKREERAERKGILASTTIPSRKKKKDRTFFPSTKKI